MRFLFFGLVLLIYTGLCAYMGIKLLCFIRFFLPDMKVLIFWLFFALLGYGLVFANFFYRHNLFFLRTAGSYWMAVFIYLPFLFALSAIAGRLLFLFGKTIPNFQIYSVGASLLLCVLLIAYGALHARSIHTVNYRVTVPGSGNNIRIALISDTHMGNAVGSKWVRKVVDTINSAEPDMVCIAGDIFDGNVDTIADLQGMVSELKRLNAPLGVFACLGNHDVDRMLSGGTERIEEILLAAGIILLQDEAYPVRENLFVAGRRDARPIGMIANRKTPRELCAGLDGAIIMLDHQPAEFARMEQAGTNLLLCGHTHAGQLFPANLLTRRIFKRAGAVHYGHWQGETMQAVVTSGAGFWGPPVRIATNCEVAVIDVSFAP